jgi:pimeloyl-ACP methyl ester carboxylesterase
MGQHVRAGDLDIWTEQVGEGPDVLLIGGLGDTVESWQFQLDGLADRYRLTAFDNRGAGRTVLPAGAISAKTMADDAAAVLQALGVGSAHVAGFSMGSAIAQELALRHPELVRSLVLTSTYARPDALWRSQLSFWHWLVEVAPSERALFEAFFTWVYTPRVHADGSVDQLVEEALAFPTRSPWRPFRPRSRRALRTTRPTASPRSPRRRSSCPVTSTASCPRALVEPWPRRSPTPASRSWLGRPTSPSRRLRGSGTPASTPSGGRSRHKADIPLSATRAHHCAPYGRWVGSTVIPARASASGLARGADVPAGCQRHVCRARHVPGRPRTADRAAQPRPSPLAKLPVPTPPVRRVGQGALARAG